MTPTTAALESIPRKPAIHAKDWAKWAALFGLMALLYSDTLIDMARDWWNVPAWSQGMLLPPLAAYIAWMRREATLKHPAVTDSRGLFLAAFASLMFLSGRLASEFFLTRISFVLMLAALVWSLWGAARLKTLVFPLLLLAAMVPLPALLYNAAASPLQLFASKIATFLAQAAGISVHQDGNIIELAGVSLGVAEACSGLNSLSALVVGSLLLGFTTCTGTAARIVLFAISIPLAVAINVVRVTATAILADYNQEFAMGLYHLFSGWLVFLAGLGVLYATALLLHRLLERP